MPPRKRSKPSSAPVAEEDELITREAARLRARAEGHLLQKRPPRVSAAAAPPSLRRCDGLDIVKRNASRKKKYLVVFPGAASLPSGAKVGTLSGLDTRTPTLDVDVPPLGRIRMTGSLVFPKNCLTTVKVPVSKKKPLHVVDTFETLIVFSEWAWVGDQKSNPAGLPEPLPVALTRKREKGEVLWKTHCEEKSERDKKVGVSVVVAKGKKADGAFVVDAAGDMNDLDIVEDGEDEVAEIVDEADEDDWDKWQSTFSNSVAEQMEPRSNPRRKRKRVSYVDDEDDDMDGIDDDEEGEEIEAQVLDDVAKDNGDDEDDDPGYNVEEDLLGSEGNASF